MTARDESAIASAGVTPDVEAAIGMVDGWSHQLPPGVLPYWGQVKQALRAAQAENARLREACQIIDDLAPASPILDDNGDCAYCNVYASVYAETIDLNVVDDHLEFCVWRKAREFLALAPPPADCREEETG